MSVIALQIWTGSNAEMVRVPIKKMNCIVLVTLLYTL